MNSIFSGIPLPTHKSYNEYDCGGSWLLLFNDCEKADFSDECSLLEEAGYSLFDSLDICDCYHKTYCGGDKIIHIYFCECERTMRIVADLNTQLYITKPEGCQNLCQTTLWMFEVDHSLIDCGMCMIIRCCDGSFFVVDSAHMYSVNDDIRICKFLKKLSGGKKPVVAGWFFSHSHEDHVEKFLDIVEYHRSELEIQAVYYNFPPVSHRDNGFWSECSKNSTLRFENVMNRNPDIKRITLHTGQRFYVRNLEFTVLCTHEDIYPNSLADFNNSSTVLMMEAQGSRVLFPGDASAESDKVLVSRYGVALKCDIVQVSHHGHFGTSPEFYRLANARCALFAVTQIKFDEEFPVQEANRTAVELADEYHIASNGTVEIPLPYALSCTRVLPDETFEDFNGIYNLWGYEYTPEMKKQLYKDFLVRKEK